MYIGIDLGYNSVKVVSSDGRATFPSVVGTPEESSFKVVGSQGEFSITMGDKRYNIGNSAIEQSRFITRSENRDWIDSEEYLALLHAALSTIQESGGFTTNIVTGLPLAYYDDDKDKIKDRFEMLHQVRRGGRAVLRANIEKCYVVPQPMGALASLTFDESGNISRPEFLNSRVGIIDIGGKTTNILHAYKMRDIQTETESINIGAWDIVKAMRKNIEAVCQGANYNDHEIMESIKYKRIKYSGTIIDIRENVEVVLNNVCSPIISKVRELWAGDGARLDRIVISGGGSLLIGQKLSDMIEHQNVTLIEDPVYANADGYYKLAMFKSKQENG